jgi:phage tail-like protein
VPQFTVNPKRVDPYKKFKFRVKWDGKVIPGISRVGSLRRTTDVVEYREGSDPSVSHRSPGRSTYAPIVLERGVTHDTAFEDWANQVWRLGGGAGHEVALAGFRKDVRLEILNEAGQLVLAFAVHRCWPSVYQPLPDLDAAASMTLLESLTLEHEGWERDLEVVEPVEPA